MLKKSVYAFATHIKPQLIFFPLEYTNDGGIAAILNLAMSRDRASTNQTFFAGEKFRDYLLYCACAVIIFGSFSVATACRHPKGAIFVHKQNCFSFASLKLYRDGINNEYLEIPK